MIIMEVMVAEVVLILFIIPGFHLVSIPDSTTHTKGIIAVIIQAGTIPGMIHGIMAHITVHGIQAGAMVIIIITDGIITTIITTTITTTIMITDTITGVMIPERITKTNTTAIEDLCHRSHLKVVNQQV